MQNSIVLGIDPGYERLGVAVLENKNGKHTLLHSDCIRTKATLPFSERLRVLGEGIEILIQKYKPEKVALEKLYFNTNQKTAMGVAEVRGVLTYISATHRLPLHEYTPAQIKVAVTSYGKSDKKQVAFMLTRLLSLGKKVRLDDEFDAIAVGLTCLVSER